MSLRPSERMLVLGVGVEPARRACVVRGEDGGASFVVALPPSRCPRSRAFPAIRQAELNLTATAGCLRHRRSPIWNTRSVGGEGERVVEPRYRSLGANPRTSARDSKRTTLASADDGHRRTRFVLTQRQRSWLDAATRRTEGIDMMELHVLCDGYVREGDELRVGSTVGFVRDGDALVVIDPGMVASAASILDPLLAVGVAPSDITDVVLSHHHPDHTVNVGLFPGARVHDFQAIYVNDLWIDRPAEGFQLSPNVDADRDAGSHAAGSHDARDDRARRRRVHPSVVDGRRPRRRSLHARRRRAPREPRARVGSGRRDRAGPRSAVRSGREHATLIADGR